jgi:hypothetical protein
MLFLSVRTSQLEKESGEEDVEGKIFLFFHPFVLLLVRIACVFRIFQQIRFSHSGGVEGSRPFSDVTLCTLKMVIHVLKDPCVFIFRVKQPTKTLLGLTMQTQHPFET